MQTEPPGWYSRGYLPHYDDGVRTQAITYRLVDALPTAVTERLREQRELSDDHRFDEIERFLNAGHGSCLLRNHRNAQVVIQGWRHFAGRRYHLHGWCVMPNHVHVLITPMVGQVLVRLVQSQKSYTAKEILRRNPGSAGLRPALLQTAGGAPALPVGRQIWQPDYYDRFMRNERHFNATLDYIHQNPVVAGLVARAEDWPWSSARGRV
jgi:REP element-mobilizing transposase RayT